MLCDHDRSAGLINDRRSTIRGAACGGVTDAYLGPVQRIQIDDDRFLGGARDDDDGLLVGVGILLAVRNVGRDEDVIPGAEAVVVIARTTQEAIVVNLNGLDWSEVRLGQPLK